MKLYTFSGHKNNDVLKQKKTQRKNYLKNLKEIEFDVYFYRVSKRVLPITPTIFSSYPQFLVATVELLEWLLNEMNFNESFNNKKVEKVG